jgi:hypothetical protein
MRVGVNRISQRWRRRLVLSLMAAPLVLASCRDQSPLAPGNGASRRTEFGTGPVRLALTSTAGERRGELSYELRLVPGGSGVGRTGRASLHTGAFEIVALTAAPSSGGELRLVTRKPTLA